MSRSSGQNFGHYLEPGKHVSQTFSRKLETMIKNHSLFDTQAHQIWSLWQASFLGPSFLAGTGPQPLVKCPPALPSEHSLSFFLRNPSSRLTNTGAWVGCLNNGLSGEKCPPGSHVSDSPFPTGGAQSGDCKAREELISTRASC